MSEIRQYYFKNDIEWRSWLHENHSLSEGIFLIFYKVGHPQESMRWEEAVKVALCFGWIDSTVKGLGDGKRQQYFCPRRTKSTWSKLNKTYIVELTKNGLMHESGALKIADAKKDGSWTLLDQVENGVIPDSLQRAFDQNPKAFNNYQNFTQSQRKSYLYWLNQAKREATKQKRIDEIIACCAKNIKTRI